MQPKLKAKMDHMDHRLSKMIEVMGGLNEEQLHHKPGGQWSPAQIFQHLLDSEVGSPYIFWTQFIFPIAVEVRVHINCFQLPATTSPFLSFALT